MVKAKPNQKIHVDKLQTAFDKLDQLESKPKEELSLRESIFFLHNKLTSALKKGYSYQDLSEILAEQDILISAATLKQYLTEIGKKSPSSRKRSKATSLSSREISTNVTDSQSDKNSSLENTETNRIKESSSKNDSQSNGKKATDKKAIKTKPKVLSGFDDDLESDFNQY
jgi:hypothetical protein